MTGPEHYREAERLLASTLIGGPDGDRLDHGADRPSLGSITDPDHAGCGNIAAAQVHATLALAAATAEPIAQSYCGDEAGTVSRAWSKAIS